jgi:hypothetical protein
MSAALEIQKDGCGLLGIEDISHAAPGTADRMLRDLNASLQHIYTLMGDSFWCEEPQGYLIRGPQSVTVSVTQKSQAITITGYSSWMAGCTIVIPGDEAQNVIITAAGASPTLLKPYTGPTAAGVVATIYQDVIQPGDNVRQVIPPVVIEGKWELVPLESERTRQTYDAGGTMNSNHGAGPWLYPLTFAQREIQTPTAFLIVQQSTFNGSRGPVLRFSSLPDEQMVITMKVEQTAPRVTAWNDSRTWLVPHAYHESILMPIFRMKFSSWPQFAGNRNDLQDDYDTALAMLESLKPHGYVESNVVCAGDFTD